MTERKVGKRKKKKVNKINTLRSGGKLKSNFGDIAIMKNKKIHEPKLLQFPSPALSTPRPIISRVEELHYCTIALTLGGFSDYSGIQTRIREREKGSTRKVQASGNRNKIEKDIRAIRDIRMDLLFAIQAL